MVSAVLLFSAFATFVCASPAASNFVLHESVDHAPEGFSLNGPAQISQSLSLRIALASKDMPGLEKALYDVSTPGSALYGQHLSKEEVESFVSPTPETVAAVDQWLSSFGVSSTKISPAGDWIGVDVPVSKANEMLNAQFSEFTDNKTGKKVVRTLSYSIPAAVQGHVDLVHPTIVFPIQTFGIPKFSTPVVAVPASNLTSSAVPASCATTITPACLQALYGIPTAKATQASNGLGVSGFIDQFAQSADLKSFIRKLRRDLTGETFALQTIDGGTNPQGAANAGIEANLDIQYTIGVASNVPTTFISVGPNNNDGILSGFLDIINFLLGETNPPHVLTTSYGFNENEITAAIANNLCNAYMQLGARGTSIFFASGDGGVSGIQPGSCTTFLPTFPAGCPFLTSVGGTTGISPETSASFSSGGFSNLFTRPSYQDAAVSSYLTSIGSLNAGLFNTSGRAFPDISAQAENVEIVSGGVTGTVAGTSCSSPIFASVVALLNDQLITAGKSPLGFLNPFLYSSAGTAALTDVTTGSNPGCGTNGFPATLGWDPVTGLGTPNFAALRTAVGLV